ncbi:hypothetical protein ACTJJ0_08130 [Chitinophaga sp. 22321]|uniref:Lipoprotein n=1 Tax=Chitinophaga hostae TaxID=2831022 RepID=A0ABS5ITU5_9BACT|nr:hypothetical protein [Chitinophaga hostae]MBS0026326.1 hypothetical protein [Chitinophaga hostae]
MKSYFSTNRVLAWTITSVAVATIFFACKKEVTTDTAPNNQSDNNTIGAVQHEAIVSAMYGDLFETAATVGISQGMYTGRKANPGGGEMADQPQGCPSAELLDATGNTWPKRVDIDFGTSCLDRYGVFRSGVLHVIFSGPLFSPGATIVVEPRNYKLNGKAVEGRFVISGVSYSTTNGIQYTTELTNGKVTLSDSVVINYASKKTVKQIAGVDKDQPFLNPSDDVFSVEGNAALSYVKGPVTGATANFSTEEALIKAWSCAYISKGKLKVEFDKITGVINYGDGLCDDVATITVGDKAKEIKLKP